MQLQQQYFVVAAFPEQCRAEQPLLRADAPVTAKQMAVHPQIAFVPPGHVEVAIARLLQSQSCLEKHARPRRLTLQWTQRGQPCISQWEAMDLPVTQPFAIEPNVAHDALAIDHRVAVTHVAEAVDQDVQQRLLAAGALRQCDTRIRMQRRVPDARYAIHVTTIDKYQRVIARALDFEFAPVADGTAIQNHPVILAKQQLVGMWMF